MAFEKLKKQKELKRLIKNNNFKEIVNFINSNIEDEEFDFSLIEDTYGINEADFIKLFDNEGNMQKKGENNIYKILFTKELKELMIKKDDSWKEDFSELQIKYINYSLKNPEIDFAFRFISIRDIDATLKECFDGKDINDNLFKLILFEKDVLKKIIKNPNFKNKFSSLEVDFINKCDKLDTNISEFLYTKKDWRQILPKYFDGNKLLPVYYKELIFDNYLNDQMYIDIENYFKHLSKVELLFINLIKDDYFLKNVCKELNLNSNNLEEYFEIVSDTLKLKKDIVKKALKSRDYSLFLFISERDYDMYELNDKEILIINTIKKEKNINLKKSFLEILKQKEEIIVYNEEQLKSFLNLLSLLTNKLKNTNSSELHKFKADILVELMNNPNPERALELINDVYTKNNLPDVGKAYLTFKILHPDYKAFDFSESSSVSPVLKDCKNDNERDMIIFSDLLKASFGSNNRSIRDYLTNIKEGNELFLKVDKNNINTLSVEEIITLKIFVNHLKTLYNNTKKGKDFPQNLSGNLIEDIENFKKIFKVTDRYDLPDRIVRSFGYFAGFKSYNDAWEYFTNKVEIADSRNRYNSLKLSVEDFKLEQGDFVKGIGDLKYFKTILQNGSVAKEFLSIGASSDMTPLDTDLIKITKEIETLDDMVNYSRSSSYGPIYFVLKHNDGITVTRDEFGNKNDYDFTDIEAFSTGSQGHYGIRSGFAITEVDYIIIDNTQIETVLPEVKHTIVTNGFYIPVIDSKSGKLIFNIQEYDEMKKKISGLKYYVNDDFIFSNNLNIDQSINGIKENIDNNIEDTKSKKKKILDILNNKFSESGIELKDYFDSDISLGNVQLIDTGSTGRGTMTGTTSDFDFIMRIDSNMKTEYLKDLIFRAFNVSQNEDKMKNIRLKNIIIDGLIDPIDIDISFVNKSETNFYSTDAALKDRLEQIKKQDSEKYKDVIANIILAKKVLKESGVYKPNHSRDIKEGGLGSHHGRMDLFHFLDNEFAKTMDIFHFGILADPQTVTEHATDVLGEVAVNIGVNGTLGFARKKTKLMFHRKTSCLLIH